MQTEVYLVDDSTCNYDIAGLMRRAPTNERRQKKCANNVMVLSNDILFYTLMTLFYMNFQSIAYALNQIPQHGTKIIYSCVSSHLLVAEESNYKTRYHWQRSICILQNEYFWSWNTWMWRYYGVADCPQNSGSCRSGSWKWCSCCHWLYRWRSRLDKMYSCRVCFQHQCQVDRWGTSRCCSPRKVQCT